MLARMDRRPLAACLAAFACLATQAHARTMEADIAKITLAVATLDDVHVRLDWPADATTGTLALHAVRVQAPSLGLDARHLDWTCPLQRAPDHGWRCEGPLRSGRQRFVLAIAFDDAGTSAQLRQGRSAALSLRRDTATPDLSRIDLTRVPIAWAQSLLSKSWADARLLGGTLEGRVDVAAPTQGPLRIAGRLHAAGVKLETTDASIATDHLGGRFDFDYRIFDAPRPSLLTLDSTLQGGEFLAGTVYVALPDTPVAFSLSGEQTEAGWTIPAFAWRDAGALVATGRAAFDADANLQVLDVQARSDDLAPLKERYLTGPLGTAGLSDLALLGALDLHLHFADHEVQAFDMQPHAVDIVDPATKRFAFRGLDGDLRFSRTTPVVSALQWEGGALYGLAFDAARLPLRSEKGVISLTAPVPVPLLGGTLRFDDMTLRPPAQGLGAEAVFGISVDQFDVGQLAQAFGFPAFRGTLTGRLPRARYAREVLTFDGGLSLAVFDGRVDVSSLSMERPFGVAPTLAADVRIDDLDLLALTEVFDFGSITGRLDGRIDALRLVDWSVTAFDAALRTDPDAARRHKAKQRISQRAVQSISSVGDASFMSTLQGQLIGVFDDFGYRRIGIGCRLANEVCAMTGLDSSQDAFTIVQGAGLPRLTVVGIHRQVDWPTLVERLAAVGSGEVAPVVE